jgi:toxin ParE2
VLRAFDAELRHRRNRLSAHPLSGHPCHSRYRRCNLKGFPYALVYRLKGEFIYLIAFIHERRLPLYWLRRIKDDTD